MSKPKFKIHFVCMGNTFRSRLIEAYLNSKKLNLEVSSSGICADDDFNGFISWYALRILKNNDLVNFAKRDWTQTTEKILNNSDLVIFIGKINYDRSVEKLNFKGKYEIWNIPDVDDLGYNTENLTDGQKEYKHEFIKIQNSDKIFEMIKTKTNELIKKLKLI